MRVRPRATSEVTRHLPGRVIFPLAGLLIAGCAAASPALTALAPPAQSATASPLSSGTTLDPIAQVVVDNDDRTLLVPTSWDGCEKKPPDLEATQSSAEVTLALIESTAGAGPSCPGPPALGQAQTVLSSSLAQRRLIDRSTGSAIPTVREDQLAPVTDLPSGYSYSGIVPRIEVGTNAATTPVGATRTYSSTDKSAPPLWIIQFPGESAIEAEVSWDPEAASSVHGQPAILQSEPVAPQSASPVARWVAWAEDGWVFVVDSPAQGPQRTPLSNAQLLAVAEGLEVVDPPQAASRVLK